MLPGKTYTVDSVLALVQQQRWLIVLPFLGCTFLAAVAAWTLPSVWKSTAVISIVPQRIPESYVRSTVTLNPQERVEALRRDILSRPKLEGIIQELDLYAEERQAGGMESVVNQMRRDVSMLETKGEAFEVSFSAGDPVLAQRVAQRLAGLFIEENIRQRTQLADGSSEFLKGQLDQVKAQLVATERRLEAYRRDHVGELPDQVASNLQAISSTQLQLQQIRESINRDRDRRLLMERQIGDLEQPVADGPPMTAGSTGTGTITTASAATQLQQALATLAELERRVTPEHPDVIRTKAAIRQLTIKAREEAEQLQGDNLSDVGTSPAEVLRRRRLRDVRAEMASLDRGIDTKLAEERRLQTMASEYQGRVNAAPTRESELTSLLRDYETVSEQYRLLLTNSQSAEMAQDLERRQGGEQFRLLEAARVPEHPAKPKRPLILAGGAAGGLALGIGLLALFELRDRSLRSKDDVPAFLGLPVLAAVPIMLTTREHRMQLRRSAALWSVAVLLLAGAAVAGWGALHR